MQKIAEVIEASTTEFVAQCYELYGLPPLGALVKTNNATIDLYGIVYNAATASVEPGRRPIARGKDEATEEAIYRDNPQLAKLLRSEFSALVVGYGEGAIVRHHLPANPARIHGFVHGCDAEEVEKFSSSLAFLNVLIRTRLPIPVEEVAGAALRQMSQAHDDPRSFLIAAGKELAVLLGDDYGRLRATLARLKTP